MAVQSTYLSEQAVAYAGMIANTEPCTLISRNVETAAIGFGLAVKQGTADDGVVAASGASDVFRGITVRDQSVRTTASATDQFAVGDSARLMTKGVIWVTAHDGVVAGAAVYMNVTSKKFTDTSTSNLPVPNAIFDSSGGADDLVKVRLR